MGTVICKGWWPDSDSRYKEGWTVAIRLSEPRVQKNQWVSVSVPVKGEAATVKIEPINGSRIYDGLVVMIKSTVYRNGERLRLYWNFNCEARHQLQITNHSGGIEFMQSIAEADIKLIDAPKKGESHAHGKA